MNKETFTLWDGAEVPDDDTVIDRVLAGQRSKKTIQELA